MSCNFCITTYVFLHCFSPKQFTKERQQETLVLLNNLVYLVKDVKQHLKLYQVEVLCRLVECLITIIVLQKKGIDNEDESGNENESDENLSTPFQLADIPNEVSSLFEKQCEFVENFVNTKLPSFLENSDVTDWKRELQVSTVEITELVCLFHLITGIYYFIS